MQPELVGDLPVEVLEGGGQLAQPGADGSGEPRPVGSGTTGTGPVPCRGVGRGPVGDVGSSRHEDILVSKCLCLRDMGVRTTPAERRADALSGFSFPARVPIRPP